jgi:hypothetical protein
MLLTRTARSIFGLAVLLLATFLGLALMARSDGPVFAFASSPVSPLPIVASRQASTVLPAWPWMDAVGLVLVALGAALVLVGVLWLIRLR